MNASVLRYNATWEGLCDHYTDGNGRYYLEGLASFVDTNDEWFFEAETKSVLRLKPPPQGARVRGRVSYYALAVTNSSFIDFANLSFHATTLSAAGDVSNLTFTSLTFNYSSISRRSLGNASPPIGLTIWRSKDAEQRSPTTGPSNFVLDDVVVRYSDGPALQIRGDGTKYQIYNPPSRLCLSLL
jgi:hypothetical protein